MDLKSLNSGTVESKGWLTPVVGTLTANAVVSKGFALRDPVSLQEVRVGGAAYASQDGFASPIYNLPAASYIDVSTASAEGGFIPPYQLQVGSTLEIYMAGRFTRTPTASGALTFYPTFVDTSPSLNCLTEIIAIYDNVAGPLPFEFRCTFRVIAITDTTIQCRVSYNCVTGSSAASVVYINTDSTPNVVQTPSRAANAVFPFKIFAGGATDLSLTRDQYYVRQIV